MSTATESQESRASRRGKPTWEIAFLYPPQGYWSETAYLDLNTNHLIEFVDGFLEFLPMPTLFHQAIVLFLYSTLNAFVRCRVPGEVSVAPCRVRTIPGKYREPDVLYVRPERVRDRNQPTEGADLAMEVVSGNADDRSRDLEEKRQEYAKAGISEYWIVDPKSGPLLSCAWMERLTASMEFFPPDSRLPRRFSRTFRSWSMKCLQPAKARLD